MVAVSVSHFSASPKKGNRLLLDHRISDGDTFSILTQFSVTELMIVWLASRNGRFCLLENSSRRALSTKCDASSWPWSFTSSW